ncbi:hypothetical protein EMIT0P4_60155 [Pseudomonas sp. IT-P4]
MSDRIDPRQQRNSRCSTIDAIMMLSETALRDYLEMGLVMALDA